MSYLKQNIKKDTKVISGFPGTGKSFLFNNQSDLIILDSDSSHFSWIKDKYGNNTKDRNPNFPDNYIKHIQKNIGKVDIIFISSHKIVQDALKHSNIHYTIIYPDKSLKNEWIIRFKNRGNNKEFIEFISNNWDSFIDEIEENTFHKKIKLNSGEYIADVLFDII